MRWTLALALGLIVGCAAPPRDRGDSVSLQIVLFAARNDGRYTYFELGADRLLKFGGGRSATVRAAEPAAQLSDADHASLVALVEQHRLLQARGRMFAGKGKQVRYEVELRMGDRSRKFQCVDDEVPGVAQLHEALFDLQGRGRYEFKRIQ